MAKERILYPLTGEMMDRADEREARILKEQAEKYLREKKLKEAEEQSSDLKSE